MPTCCSGKATGILLLLFSILYGRVRGNHQESPPDEIITCVGKQDGAYPKVSEECRTYYRCYNGSQLNHECNAGFAFDVASGKCSPAEKVNCQQESDGLLDCDGKPDGVYVDFYSHCHNYYWCEDGVKMDFTCGQHMAFDLRTSSCMDASLTPCHIPLCTSKENGYYALPGTDSKLYFSCQDGTPTATFTCPAGKSLDPQVAACRNLPFVNPGVLDCTGKADGYYPNFANNCHSFYYCNKNQLSLVLACPSGKAFNILTNQCEEAGLVTCSMTHWSRSFFSGCDGKADGLYPDFAIECKSFYDCQGGQRIHNFSCPDGQRFNRAVEKCDDGVNVVCSTATVQHFQNFCVEKLDGFYPNLVTGCRSFLYCQEGRIASEITCPKDNVYDVTQKHCIEETEASVCAADVTQWECVGNKDGYYSDFSSSCQKYFYCGGGSKLLELICPVGKLFDPILKQCTEESLVSCEPSPGSPDCAGLSDGYYPNISSNCRKFFYCRGREKVSEMSCLPDQMFDQEGQACAGDHSTTCKGSTITEECLMDGFQGDVSSKCENYFFCFRGRKLQTFQCPDGTLFDSVWGICIGSELAQCRPKSLSENCVGKPNGFHPLSTAFPSVRFYLCQNNHLAATLDCPPGGIFNFRTSKCEPRKVEPQCNRGTEVCCAGLPDGFYLNKKNGSSEFYSCFKSHLTKHTCPDGLFLDSNTISCIGFDKISRIANTRQDCILKEDEFVTDADGNCRRFHLCVKGERKLTGLCPLGSVFDERSGHCRSPQHFQCPTSRRNDPGFDCTDKPNAYYADVTRNCSRFFLCIEERHVATNSCTEGSTFVQREQHCKPTNLIDEDCSSDSETSTTTNEEQTPTADDNNEVSKPLDSNQFSSTSSTPSAHNLFVSNFQKSFEMPEAQPTFPSQPYLLEDLTCKDKTNGVYPDFNSGCHQFYICFREVKMEFSCSGTLLFNPRTNMCDDSTEVVCEQFLGDNKPEILPAEDTSNDVKSRDTSGGNLLNQPPNHHHQQAAFTCTSLETGFFPDYSSGCRDFYVCFRGIQKIYSCPTDLLFNPTTKNCDAANNVVCDVIETTTHSTSTQTAFISKTAKEKSNFPFSNADVTSFDCPKKSRGVHPDVTSRCRNYFICMDGAVHKASCPPGTRYSTKMKRCDLETKVNCQNGTSNRSGMLSPTDGAQKKNSSSTDVPATSTTTTTTESSVSTTISSTIGWSSVSTTVSTLPPFDCSFKPDGFYADYSRHCHVFYRCLSGHKLSFYCKLGQLFNPVLQICDFEENVQCVNSTDKQ